MAVLTGYDAAYPPSPPPATDGLEIIDITAQYPQFTVQP